MSLVGEYVVHLWASLILDPPFSLTKKDSFSFSSTTRKAKKNLGSSLALSLMQTLYVIRVLSENFICPKKQDGADILGKHQ